jgi:toxin ParE1/3/4
MNIVWRASAVDDFATIVEFIAQRNAVAAENLKLDIHSCIKRVMQFPFMYRAGRVAGTREAVVHPNYLIIYRVAVEAVEIIAVVHARRNYP